jgi:lysophospholipase L1-like esterase
MDMKTSISVTMLALFGAAAVFAQTPAPTSAPQKAKARPPWELEWAYLSKYHDANVKLGAPAPGKKRVVFLGDSITEGWGQADAKFFSGRAYVDRGISGQTTSQMLVRFRQDVIGLRPAVVVILGGTNDIAENGGITTLEAIEDNLQSMAELAKVNGMRVVLSSVLPADRYPWHPGIEPAGKIAELNRWIAGFCAKNGLVYLDYYSAMADAKGGLPAELSQDGVHPNGAGYAVMEPLAEEAVRRALQ